MEASFDIISLIFNLGPALSALACFIILSIGWQESHGKHIRRLKGLLLGFYALSVLSWIETIFEDYYSGMMINLIAVIYITCFYAQTIVYHYVYTVTRPENKNFSIIHYLIPLALVLVLFIWQQFIPPEAFSETVEQHVIIVSGKFHAFTVYVNSLSYVIVLYSVIYAVISLRLLRDYRRRLPGNDPEAHRRVWRVRILTAVVVMMPLAPSFIFLSNGVIATVVWRILILLLMFQHALLCYLGITERVLAPHHRIIDALGSGMFRKSRRLQPTLDKERLEMYMSEYKPYLDSDLKITDLSAALHTNRAYLSAFINQVYGSNFSQYINKLRIMELDKLKGSDIASEYDEAELILLAGFGSRKNYLRVRKLFRKS